MIDKASTCTSAFIDSCVDRSKFISDADDGSLLDQLVIQGNRPQNIIYIYDIVFSESLTIM